MADLPAAVELPPVVAKFLREIAPLGRADLSIRPLAPEESARESAALGEAMLLAKGMGAIVLVDPGNSNPFCYVTRGLQAGSVLQLDHDGGIRFAFRTLAAFGAALRKAVARGVPVWEMPLARAKPIGDQVTLAARIVAWCAEVPKTDPKTNPKGDRDIYIEALRAREAKVSTHLPRLDPDDVDTLGVVAASENFLLREAAALFMAAHPRRAYVALARALAVDRYQQVWRPARQVLAALGAKPPPWTLQQEEEVVGDERGAAGLLFTMVPRANGKVRVTVDDVERQGRRPPFAWRQLDLSSKFDFTEAQLAEIREGNPSADKKLAEIGMAVVGRLELLQRSRRAPKRGKRRGAKRR